MRRLVVNITVDPLHKGFSFEAKKLAPVVSRYDPFRTLLRLHIRISDDKHSGSQLVAITVEFVDVRCAPSQTKVGRQRKSIGWLHVKAQIVGKIAEFVISGIKFSGVIIARGARLLVIEAHAGLTAPNALPIFLDEKSPRVVFGVIGDERNHTRARFVLVANVQV